MVEPPTPPVDQGLVGIKTLRTGICATDREIISSGFVRPPPGEAYIILGHEMLGEVVEVGQGVSNFSRGDLVVGTVRRGCGKCLSCLNQRSDMCFTGEFKERGVRGLHGYGSEYAVEKPEHLVKVPAELRDVAVLTEPLSISVKAVETALTVQERLKFDGKYPPHAKVLIAGHGPIGTLAAFILSLRDFELYVTGIMEESDAQVQLLKKLGAQYITNRGTHLKDCATELGGFFIIIEAIGHSPIAYELENYLGYNGVLVQTGITLGSSEIHLDSDKAMFRRVDKNQVIVGMVNSNIHHFRKAVGYLKEFKEKYGNLLNQVITHRYPLKDFRQALSNEEKNRVKIVIDFLS